jgi:hypothetical protein
MIGFSPQNGQTPELSRSIVVMPLLLLAGCACGSKAFWGRWLVNGEPRTPLQWTILRLRLTVATFGLGGAWTKPNTLKSQDGPQGQSDGVASI